jgi:hypothetical protein
MKNNGNVASDTKKTEGKTNKKSFARKNQKEKNKKPNNSVKEVPQIDSVEDEALIGTSVSNDPIGGVQTENEDK